MAPDGPAIHLDESSDGSATSDISPSEHDGNRKTEAGSEPLSRLTQSRPGRADFKVHRADTALFATLPGLQMQSGVPVSGLRRLALKELTDNALDAADAAGRHGHVRVEKLGEHQYVVEDEGDGIIGTPEQLAALFSLNRPMISGKFWRLPERGALGNGLRLVIGCVAATGGTIEVTTRDKRVLLRPLKTGQTDIVEAADVHHSVGTRFVVTFGPDLPEDPSDLQWAQNAVELARQAAPPYMGSASPH